MGELRRRRFRYIAGFIALIILLIILALVNICMGTVSISVNDIISAIGKDAADSYESRIILDIRMPRMFAALVLGGALSVSGFCLQTFFSNPIAGPFVLGISSGAKLVVALVLIYFVGQGVSTTSFMMVAAAFAGAMISMVFVLAVSGHTRSMGVLIICGVMIGYICSALTDFLITFADDSNIVNLHNWSMGSFSGMNWSQVRFMSVLVAICMVVAFFMAKPMGAYELGEVYAHNMGVNIRLFKIMLILLSGVLSACVTAFAGPISFVGVAVPHLAKKLFGSGKPIIIIPGSFLLGAVFCMFCDLIARLAFAPTEMSISTVTAIFGAPVVIWIMLGRRKKNE